MIEEKFISPNYTVSFPLDTIENRIAVFVDIVMGWQLNIAEDLISNNHRAGYAVMHILLSHIEMIGSYILGVNFTNTKRWNRDQYFNIKECFNSGLEFIFPEINSKPEEQKNVLYKLFYSELRCVLYHHAMARGHILLTTEIDKIYELQNLNILIINPSKFTKHIINRFLFFIEQLSNNENIDLRDKFKSTFDNTGIQKPNE